MTDPLYRPDLDRRRFLLTSLAGVLAVPLAAEAQQLGKVYRIGFLKYSDCSDPGSTILRQSLREFGYVEGRNIVIECRAAPGKTEQLPELATELVHLNVDVLVTESTVATLAAKRATRTIPVVMVAIGDPVESGIVSSLARPGANITGLSVLFFEITRKHLEFLKEIAPRASRASVLMDSTNPGQTLPYQHMEASANTLGVRLQRVDLRYARDLDGAFAATLKQRPEALLVYPLPGISLVEFERVAEFAAKSRLPTITAYTPYIKAGLLMLYGPNIPEQYRRAGVYIDKILHGAKPADLPIEQPTKYEFVINLKTAKALGLTIPPSLLARADQVIE